MIAAIKRFLRRQRTEHLRRKALRKAIEQHRALALRAAIERQKALDEFQHSLRRGDTRRQHETFASARQATNDLLRTELGR